MSTPINQAFRNKGQHQSDDDFYYVNIYWNNANPQSIIGQSLTTFTNAILPNGKDYWLTTVDFVLDGSYIPIFYFENNTYYVVLTWGNFTSGPVAVIYHAYDVFPSGSGLNTVFYYQHFVNMINQAFTTAFATLSGSAGFPGTVTEAPYMYYDPITQTCPIYVQYTYIANNVNIFMNNILYNFFSNYPAIYLGENNPTKMDYQIQVIDYNTLNDVTVNSVPCVKVNQEFSSLYHWFDCVEITVVSSTLGTRPEIVPTTIPTGTGLIANNAAAGIGPATNTQIASFKPYWSDATGPHSWLYFTATGPFRPINVISDEIRSFDLQIFYRTKNGSIYPYYLPANEAVQIKFMFMRRDQPWTRILLNSLKSFYT